METTGLLLLVEDNSDDVLFMQRALKKAEITNPLQVAADGQQAIDYLLGSGKYSEREAYPLPLLVLLDLKLPHKTGLQVLAHIRQQSDLKKLPVIILSSSREEIDIEQAYSLGANAFLVKPSDNSTLTEMMKALKSFWLTSNEFARLSPSK